jgi:predicted GIY-YIG superfamily endonuclease
MSATCTQLPQSTEAVSTTQQVIERYVFVLQQHDGTFIIGVSTNPAKRIAAINSGMNPHIKQSLTIKTVVGIKPVTADRNLITVVKTFADKHGEDKLIVV